MTEENLTNCLVSEAPPPQFVNKKEGTLTIDHTGSVAVAKDTLRVRLEDKKEGNHKENPLSVPRRIENLAEYLARERTFYVIRLKDEQVAYFKGSLAKPQSEKASDVLQKTLALWTKPVDIDGRTLTPPLGRVLLGE